MHFILMRRRHAAWHQPRVIDVTPGARWKNALRNLAIGVALLVLVPIAWLVAGLVALALVGAGVLVVAGLATRSWWLQRKGPRATGMRR